MSRLIFMNILFCSIHDFLLLLLVVVVTFKLHFFGGLFGEEDKERKSRGISFDIWLEKENRKKSKEQAFILHVTSLFHLLILEDLLKKTFLLLHVTSLSVSSPNQQTKHYFKGIF